eukprot:scaffold72425_cov32-Tisochrysis_lutea.AAC.1
MPRGSPSSPRSTSIPTRSEIGMRAVAASSAGSERRRLRAASAAPPAPSASRPASIAAATSPSAAELRISHAGSIPSGASALGRVRERVRGRTTRERRMRCQRLWVLLAKGRKALYPAILWVGWAVCPAPHPLALARRPPSLRFP